MQNSCYSLLCKSINTSTATHSLTYTEPTRMATQEIIIIKKTEKICRRRHIDAVRQDSFDVRLCMRPNPKRERKKYTKSETEKRWSIVRWWTVLGNWTESNSIHQCNDRFSFAWITFLISSLAHPDRTPSKEVETPAPNRKWKKKNKTEKRMNWKTLETLDVRQ